MVYFGIFVLLIIVLAIVTINLSLNPSMGTDIFIVILGATLFYTIAAGRNLVAFISNLRNLSGSKYQDAQFKAYSEISGDLLEINKIGERLWKNVTPEDLQEFKRLLNKTSRYIFRNELFVKNKHWSNMTDILREYENYWLGKRTLWDQYQKIVGNRNLNIDDLNKIDSSIKQNKQIKQKYEDTLAIIRSQSRSTLRNL